MKISLVLAFYNRQNLLDRTMATIRNSSVKDWELIIVDDASDVPCVCPEAKIIRIEPKDKWYHNPCIPYNRGFKEATGDIVIIQNPECMHIGDVLKYVTENIKDNLYLSFGCYALNALQTQQLHVGIEPIIEDKIFGGRTKAEYNGWYNHPVYRPVGYHFCSAITKADLNRVGGFDERYAHGVAYDDDAFIRSIKRLQIEVQIPIDPYVIHQYHHHFSYEDPRVWRPLHRINSDLYDRT